MSVPVRLREASAEDLQFILNLLKSNDLCFKDVPQKVDSLFVGYADSKIIGIAGVEVYGSVGLLRSVVIKEQFRRKGLGKALISGIVESAKLKGVKELYLLTTTAESYFAQMGFRKIKRCTAPAPIQNTDEFREMCSVTSILMRKKIE
jgi:amino-acid N-acetyltransferase